MFCLQCVNRNSCIIIDFIVHTINVLIQRIIEFLSTYIIDNNILSLGSYISRLGEDKILSVSHYMYSWKVLQYNYMNHFTADVGRNVHRLKTRALKSST